MFFVFYRMESIEGSSGDNPPCTQNTDPSMIYQKILYIVVMTMINNLLLPKVNNQTPYNTIPILLNSDTLPYIHLIDNEFRVIKNNIYIP